jgi:hypothetical protein
MQQLSRGGDRLEFVHERFAESTSGAWDVLDRDAARAALDRYDALSGMERKTLFGAATAVAWLD